MIDKSYNLTKIRSFVIESFTEDELTIFCSDNFQDAKNQFGQGMSFEVKTHTLVEHCRRYGLVSILVEKLQIARPARFENNPDIFATQPGSTGEAAPTVLENIQSAARKVSSAFDSLTPVDAPQTGLIKDKGDFDHPLSRDLPDVKTWFLKELKHEQQIFVMTAALFNGLERRELMDLYHNILQILEAPEQEVD